MSNETSQALNSEQNLIPTAQGGLSRLAIARLKSAGVPVAPLLRRVGLTPEAIADPEERLSVRSQIALLDEAAIALQDDCLGFTLARDFDLREIGLLYYVMASSPTLGDALKRVARYSQITNEALVIRYREGNRLIISLSYSGVPRHSDKHQIEFFMFAAIRICRVLTGQNLVPQHFWISHHRSGANSEMARFVGTTVEFGADTDDGKPRSHRDRKDIAIETAEYLKRKFPNCDVVVKDLRSGEAFAEFQNWPYEAISQIASPDDAQRSTLEALRASTTAAAERLSADCPQDEPAPSGERLVAAEQAIDTVTSSYAAVEPPLRAFFAALDDEQKARLLRGLSSLRPRASPPAPPGSSFEPVARVRSPARGT